MEIELFSDIDDEHIEERVQSFVNKEILISNFLSLFAIRHAPCVDRRYILLEEHVPMSGIFDSAHSTYLEIKRPRVPETWNNVDLDKMSKLFSKYMRMDIKQRRQLDISLSRRVQAMNSWDSVNKAIDLGIALESVLTTPKTREQLSLQIRILGSKLAAKEDEMREKVYSTLKTVYRIRSEAVHNGALDNHYKVKGEGNKNTRDIINDGLDIQRNCLIAIIEMNGLTQEDIDRLMIIK